MLVSLQPRLVSESHSRVAPRRRLAEDNEDGDIRRIFENPGDSRRQNNFARRRPQTGRTWDSDDQTAELRPALTRPTQQGFAPLAKTAEFWTLLGAVAPDANPAATPLRPLAKQVPTVMELLDQVIASH